MTVMASWARLFAWLHRRAIRTLAPLIPMLILSLHPAAAEGGIDGQADSRKETPWHAVAYSYLNVLFLLNLNAVDWELIERVMTTDHDGRILGRPASERLMQIDKNAGTDHWMAIETALAAKSAPSLYASSTRALSSAIRHHLANAAAAMNQPGLAGAEIDQAQALFRAIAGGIKQADPEGFRAIGLAWLELASSVRQAGVLSEEGLPPDHAAFASARTVLSSYLRRNFEPEIFAARDVFAPAPEDRIITDPNFKLPPWLPPGSHLGTGKPLPRLVLNIEEQGVDKADVFMVAYGGMLFNSSEIFGGPAKSLGMTCSTCHSQSGVNQAFFIIGISPHAGAVDVDSGFFNTRSNDHRRDPLDILSLRGLRFTAPYGRDGRFASLRDFTRNVIVNEFKGAEPSPLTLDALIAYMQEFDFLPAPYLNPDGRLKPNAPEAAKRGEILFKTPFTGMDNQACASCHQPSSHFTDNAMHDIGSAGEETLSRFSGAYNTPTLLSSAYTAPYFHDGRFQSFAEVVDWKDQAFSLGLSEGDREDLTAYLLTVGEGDNPYQIVDEEASPFGMMIEDLAIDLSALDILIPEQDQDHADLLLRTVARNVEQDASAITNSDAREKASALSENLWVLRDLILQDSWEDAEEAWQRYREMAEDYGSTLH